MLFCGIMIFTYVCRLLFWNPGHPDFFDPEVQARKQPYEFADDVFQVDSFEYEFFLVSLI